MAVYRIFIGENEYQIEITEAGIRINGEQVEADLLQLNEAGLYLLNHGDDKLELHLAFLGKNTYVVMADGQQIEAQVETNLSQSRRTTGALKDAKSITAPMPGIVIDVPVKVGDAVREGDVVCILESMKMQMVIQAPSAGTVVEVAAKPDTSVNKDELLVRLE